jgi:hypothetical protein
MDNPPLAIAVDVLFIGIISLLAWCLSKLRWFVRIPMAILLGWPIIIAGVALHWHILALSAATPGEAQWVAMHDSGPLAVSFVFGWAYASVVVLAAEVVRITVYLVRRLLPSW